MLLPPTATTLNDVMRSLAANEILAEVGEETVTEIKLIKITHGRCPGEGQIATAMKAR